MILGLLLRRPGGPNSNLVAGKGGVDLRRREHAITRVRSARIQHRSRRHQGSREESAGRRHHSRRGPIGRRWVIQVYRIDRLWPGAASPTRNEHLAEWEQSRVGTVDVW